MKIVGRFHPPGLAPAEDVDGSFLHVDADGRPAYAARFRKAFGFYEGLAAVEDARGWTHVDVSGRPISERRWSWCGNFQEGRAPACDAAGYVHLDAKGEPLSGVRWRYAGDFHDGAAVVQDDAGEHLHVDLSGRTLNAKRFLDLDLFHKGWARARDGRGWHHVDRDGREAYSRRFAAVEPFYNGAARVEEFDGALRVIDESGTTLRELRPPLRSAFAELSGDLVGFWRTRIIEAGVELGIFDALPAALDELCGKLALRPERAGRLLRALGQLQLVELRGAVWNATDRGAFLGARHDLTLRDAALGWANDYDGAWDRLTDAVRIQGAWSAPAWFEALAARPAEVERHHRMLRSYARHDYARLGDVIDGQRHRTLLDAGGGTGALLQSVLSRWPHLHGVLLERPEVVALAPADLDVERRGVSLFECWGAPVDAVVLARVLHDWDDSDAVRILTRAREALPTGGRLYVVELLLDETTFSGAMLDVHMLVTTGGRERGRAEFDALLATTGFRLVDVRRLPSVSSVLVAEAR